jgi:hypothetical protein
MPGGLGSRTAQSRRSFAEPFPPVLFPVAASPVWSVEEHPVGTPGHFQARDPDRKQSCAMTTERTGPPGSSRILLGLGAISSDLLCTIARR